MDTSDRMFFAFAAAGLSVWIFIALRSEWKRRRQVAGLPPHARAESQDLEETCHGVAARMEGCVLTGPGRFQLLRRGVRGRCDFISDRTEIRMETGDLIQQVVEVLPASFWGNTRIRARGSKSEYDRIFKGPADEKILFDLGAAFELRLAPEGLALILHALPGSSAALGHWISCAFRLVDLLPGVEGLGRVQVTDVKNQVTDEAMCQVCGTSLTGAPVVRCASCSTLHHADCWDYAKKCSTFGCPSARCVR
jgi:hypothetical protein